MSWGVKAEGGTENHHGLPQTQLCPPQAGGERLLSCPCQQESRGERCLEITQHADTPTGHVPLQNVWCSHSGQQWPLESHAPQVFLHRIRSGRWVPTPWLNPWHRTEQPLLLLLLANTYRVSPTGPTGPQDGSCQFFLVWGSHGSLELGSRAWLGIWDQRNHAT